MSLASFTGVYVFGDSLVDPGNALKLARAYDDLPFASLPDGAPTADQGYFQGRFSDGYVFADLISNKLIGEPTKPVFPFGFISYPFQGDPKGNNLSFGYGGAQIRHGGEKVPDLDDQTDAFRDAVDKHADPDALHLFTIGANDVRDLVPATGTIVDPATAQTVLQRAANELIEEVRQVMQIGARQVLVTGIPDVGIIPYYNGLADEAARRQAATDYSTMLDNMIRAQLPLLQATYPLVDFDYLSLTDATTNIVGNLEQLYDPAALYPLDESKLLFFDNIHPTAQAHALLAASLLDGMSGAPAGEAIPMSGADLSLRDTIAATGEVDKLVFSLAADTSYTFEMLGISSGKAPGLASWQVLADPTIRILGPGGALVGADDDGGLGLDAHLDFVTTQAGSYTLELAGAGSLIGSYLFRAENPTLRDDSYFVNSSSELVIEGAGGGKDHVYASADYVLAAGSSIERLSTDDQRGGTAINLTGNEIGQMLIGNFGDNILDGKGGNDSLWGKWGADSFAFTTPLGDGNIDALYDFNVRDDTIWIDDAIFTGLPVAPLAPDAFRTGAAALDTDDRILFDPVSRGLYLDVDGSGAAAPLQFAKMLGSTIDLTASDFLVV